MTPTLATHGRKSPVFGVAETVSTPKTPVPQRLFGDFPRRINTENNSSGNLLVVSENLTGP
jgi:hypothetical protein